MRSLLSLFFSRVKIPRSFSLWILFSQPVNFLTCRDHNQIFVVIDTLGCQWGHRRGGKVWVRVGQAKLLSPLPSLRPQPRGAGGDGGDGTAVPGAQLPSGLPYQAPRSLACHIGM